MEWGDSDAKEIANGEKVQLRSFSTGSHKVDTLVSYRYVQCIWNFSMSKKNPRLLDIWWQGAATFENQDEESFSNFCSFKSRMIR